jgi:hypothetical protein
MEFARERWRALSGENLAPPLGTKDDGVEWHSFVACAAVAEQSDGGGQQFQILVGDVS